MWNRSEVFRKSKTSWGVKLDYNDRISKSSKFADIVNFYRKLWNILENVFAWKVSLMYVDVWNWTYLWYKFLICLETGWKPKVTSSLVLNLGRGSESGSESRSVWHLIRLGQDQGCTENFSPPKKTRKYPRPGPNLREAGIKAKTNKISPFITDFHSKTSISETKGRKGVKVYIFWKLSSRPI